MNIAYLQPMRLPNPFAHSIQVVRTCRALAEQGVQVDLFVKCLDSPDVAAALSYYGVSLHENLRIDQLSIFWTGGRWRGPFFRRAVRRICRALVATDRPPAIVFIREPDIAERAVPVARSLGLPVLIEVHRGNLFASEPAGGPAAPLSQRLSDVERELAFYRVASGIVCLTDAHRRVLVSHGVETPITVIPDGVAMLDERQPSDSARDLDVIYTGQLYPWKGVEAAIAAMEFLPGRVLTVVGGNDAAQLKAHWDKARSLGLGERVRFVGQVPAAEVSRYLVRARVAVLPLPSSSVKARHFTSPLKLFEYMAAGTAIVASDLPSVREVLRDGQNALLVAPDSPRALAEAVARLLGDPALAGSLAQAARRDAAQYSWAKRAERIIDFAKSVLNTASADPL